MTTNTRRGLHTTFLLALLSSTAWLGSRSRAPQNVVATLWPVEDLATARFMATFYEALERGRSEADALSHAQRVALHDPKTTHPFFWAGFSMVRAS